MAPEDLWLNCFTLPNVRFHTHGCKYQKSIPFGYSVEVHGLDMPQFISCDRQLGWSQLLLLCLEHL